MNTLYDYILWINEFTCYPQKDSWYKVFNDFPINIEALL